jgi:hypothetical protein
LLAGFTPHAIAQYPGWQHQGPLNIATNGITALTCCDVPQKIAKPTA